MSNKGLSNYQKEYRKNPEHFKSQQRAKYKRNPEMIKEINKRWQEANPEKWNIIKKFASKIQYWKNVKHDMKMVEKLKEERQIALNNIKNNKKENNKMTNTLNKTQKQQILEQIERYLSSDCYNFGVYVDGFSFNANHTTNIKSTPELDATASIPYWKRYRAANPERFRILSNYNAKIYYYRHVKHDSKKVAALIKEKHEAMKNFKA